MNNLTPILVPQSITRSDIIPAYVPEITSVEQVISKRLPPVTQFIINELLATKKFTKRSLARELGVSLVTINRWTKGSIKRPAHKTFSRLLGLYCVARNQTEVD